MQQIRAAPTHEIPPGLAIVAAVLGCVLAIVWSIVVLLTAVEVGPSSLYFSVQPSRPWTTSETAIVTAVALILPLLLAYGSVTRRWGTHARQFVQFVQVGFWLVGMWMLVLAFGG